MTNIRFVGSLPLWLGLLLSLIVCVMAWRYYLRESNDLPDRMRWFLPLLRSLAFFMGIMILTGPVLHHRTVIGELGRVRIYVDASRSMGLLDRHISDGRKLLIAEQQGWLEDGRVDPSLQNLAGTVADVRTQVSAALQQEALNADGVAAEKQRLLSALKSVQDSTAIPEHVKNGDNNVSESIRVVEAIAVSGDQAAVDKAGEQLLAVCNSLPALERQLRKTFEDDVQRLLDGDDQSIRAALTLFDETPRWRRAERSLLETDNPLFVELKQHHNVEVFALHDQQARELFDGTISAETPLKFSEAPDAATSDLASGIVASQSVSLAKETTEAETSEEIQSANANTAIVLLTDGQHNAGPSPLQTAKVLGSQGIAFYPVSLGAAEQAADIAVTGVEHPEMVFQKDRVRGTMIVRDQMPVGQPFVAEVRYQNEVVWQQQLLTENNGERRIEFEFGIDELVERIGSQFASDVKQHAVALAMTASIAPLANEAEPNNNQRPIRLAAITQNYRLLILDGRSRWETRYLRNVFERDTQWDVDVIIAGVGNDDETLPRGDGDDMFPETRDGLFEYDLIICGEVGAELFSEHEYQWIREFVETRGGGLIFIDGSRGRMKAFSDQDLGPLLPVEWLSTVVSTQPTMLQLTEKGSRETALTFEVDATANRRFWTELPPPHTLNAVQALPGAEVLVEAIVNNSPVPAIVTRNYGAGRVLYLASDETWRWRYKAADTYHQRIWNQLAKFVMPRPFATSDEYLSVDTGPVSYQMGDSADIRIRLLGLDGKPATDATVDALVWKDGRVVSTASLTGDPDVPGIYRGNSGALADGDYEVSVRAAGFSDEALKARGRFVVLPPESVELSNTACNEELLQQIASESGGVYLREEQIGELSALLSPLSSGRVVESDDSLFENKPWSYGWLAAIVMLLTLEWFLRKRAGLL